MGKFKTLFIIICLISAGYYLSAQNSEVNVDGKIAQTLREVPLAYSETFPIRVYFNQAVNKRDAMDILERHEVEIINYDEDYNLLNRLFARVNIAQVRAIANEEIVFQIWPHSDIFISNSLAAAKLSSVDKVWPGVSAGLPIEGEGVDIYMWDNPGPPLIEHNQFTELTGRARNSSIKLAEQKQTKAGQHATAVASIMIGVGNDPLDMDTHGMAPKADLTYFDPPQVETEWDKNRKKIDVGNNTWLLGAGWDGSTQNWIWFGGVHNPAQPENYYDARFGKYIDSCKNFDSIIYNNNEDRMIQVIPSGNNRLDAAPQSGALHDHVFPPTGVFNDTHASDFQNNRGAGLNGYDSIDVPGCAKNIITVGAVDEAKNMTAFSGWGPCDDGRIKPDLVAKGVNMHVAGATGPGSYFIAHTGTSYSTPVVTGIIALIINEFKIRNYSFTNPSGSAREKPPASLVKAILIQTAEDLGRRGPDHKFGWGLVNAEDAIKFVENDYFRGGFKHIKSDTLSATTTEKKYTFTIQAGRNLLATLAWIDPPGRANTAGLDYPSPALVHDLDLRLESSQGQIFYPYKIDLSAIDGDATKGDNKVDNVEQILESIPPGDYTLIVNYKNQLTSDQAFSLVSNIPLLP